MKVGPRGRMDVVGHIRVPLQQLAQPGEPAPQNIIVPTYGGKYAWQSEATAIIGDWRAEFRSAYIRWALAINGLDIASQRYSDRAWKTTKSFTVSSLRAGAQSPAIVATMDGDTAAEAHRSTMPMLAAWGVIDLYAYLEEFIFELYRVYLRHHPDDLLKGPEHQELRKLRRKAHDDPAAVPSWQTALEARLDSWQQKHVYAGLGKTLRAFFAKTDLKQPSHYKHTTVDTWAEAVEGVACLRNALIHGSKVASKELADFSTKPYGMTFDFKEGQSLVVQLHHLQGVEMFCDQLLTAINLSIVEQVMPTPTGGGR